MSSIRVSLSFMNINNLKKMLELQKDIGNVISRVQALANHLKIENITFHYLSGESLKLNYDIRVCGKDYTISATDLDTLDELIK